MENRKSAFNIYVAFRFGAPLFYFIFCAVRSWLFSFCICHQLSSFVIAGDFSLRVRAYRTNQSRFAYMNYTVDARNSTLWVQKTETNISKKKKRPEWRTVEKIQSKEMIQKLNFRMSPVDHTKTSAQWIYFNIDIVFDLLFFFAACFAWNVHFSHLHSSTNNRPAFLFILVKDFVTNYKFSIVPEQVCQKLLK